MQSSYQIENVGSSKPQFMSEVFAGDSMHAQRLRLQVQRMAPYFRTLLVSGETGAGKTSVARELHRLSPVAHLRYSSSGITEFLANRTSDPFGMLFLNGLEQLSDDAQEALMHRFQALGREARVVISCNCDPRGLVSSGRLRPEVFTRIATLEIRVPALRERLEDLPHMLARLSSRSWTADDRTRMEQCGWLANLQELRSFCEHADASGEPDWTRLAAPAAVNDEATLSLNEVVQRHVVNVLQHCAGNKLRAAEMLGISRSTLYRMLEA